MPASLAHRFGFGNGRAVANAEDEVRRHDREERIVAELVAALSLDGEVRGSRPADGADAPRVGSASSAA